VGNVAYVADVASVPNVPNVANVASAGNFGSNMRVTSCMVSCWHAAFGNPQHE